MIDYFTEIRRRWIKGHKQESSPADTSILIASLVLEARRVLAIHRLEHMGKRIIAKGNRFVPSWGIRRD